MHSRIARWGNSLALRLPKAAVEELHLREGQAVDIALDEGRLVIRSTRPRYSLAELVGAIDPASIPESFDDGPKGREAL